MIFQTPSEIEQASMQIITSELNEKGILLPCDEAPVILRVIHATADFDYVNTLRFTPDALSFAVQALRNKPTIVTDTNMELAGISQNGLSTLDGRKICFMADPLVAKNAKDRGITRACASIEKAAALFPGCIFAVGNAPTALFEIVRQMEQGFRPALVVAVPVGFVNVTEAKETILKECTKRNVPCIAAIGRKGGSTVAAAVVNALIYQAAEMTDPGKRGW